MTVDLLILLTNHFTHNVLAYIRQSHNRIVSISASILHNKVATNFKPIGPERKLVQKLKTDQVKFNNQRTLKNGNVCLGKEITNIYRFRSTMEWKKQKFSLSLSVSI